MGIHPVFRLKRVEKVYSVKIKLLIIPWHGMLGVTEAVAVVAVEGDCEGEEEEEEGLGTLREEAEEEAG